MTVSIRGSNVLVTGGTGSFGHRVAAELQTRGARSVTIFSRDEKKQYEMRLEYPHFRYFLGDVRDASTVENAMDDIDIVFHAAALKQVPSCEAWPMEAVAANVLGSNNVFRAARRAGVASVVALSTDKAVKPVNAMGMSKALMEKLVGQYAALGGDTMFSCVRYGNVLGSRGSVVPVFRAQIDRGGPVTLTVPQMTRFLLTLDEAVGLVFHAMERARGGEVFIRKAPACRMDLLADAVVALWATGRPIERKRIGMRIGEKIHEVLINEYEMVRARDSGDFFVIPPPAAGEPADDSASDAFPEYTSASTPQIENVDTLVGLLRRAENALEEAN